MPIVVKSGSLNLLEPSGTVQACNEIAVHFEYVILIAFPRQEWLLERASVLRLYVLCLSCRLFTAVIRIKCQTLYHAFCRYEGVPDSLGSLHIQRDSKRWTQLRVCISKLELVTNTM